MLLTIPLYGPLVLEAKHPSSGRAITIEFDRDQLRKPFDVKGVVGKHRNVRRMLVEPMIVVLFTPQVPGGLRVPIEEGGYRVALRGDLFGFGRDTGVPIPSF